MPPQASIAGMRDVRFMEMLLPAEPGRLKDGRSGWLGNLRFCPRSHLSLAPPPEWEASQPLADSFTLRYSIQRIVETPLNFDDIAKGSLNTQDSRGAPSRGVRRRETVDCRQTSKKFRFSRRFFLLSFFSGKMVSSRAFLNCLKVHCARPTPARGRESRLVHPEVNLS